MYCAIHDVTLAEGETSKNPRINELTKQVSRKVAEGIMATSEGSEYECFSEVISLGRSLDEELYSLATEIYQKTENPQENPVFEKLIQAFFLADQLKEMLFYRINEDEKVRDIA
jgi:hypothetical protein